MNIEHLTPEEMTARTGRPDALGYAFPPHTVLLRKDIPPGMEEMIYSHEMDHIHKGEEGAFSLNDLEIVPGLVGVEKSLEDQLLEKQMSLLDQQQKLSDLILPSLLKNAGYDITYDESGNIVGLTQSPEQTALAQSRSDIEKGFLERTKKALAGELDVSPALLKDLGKAETAFNERMRRQLGPGWETSTPGIQAMGEFTSNKQNILESARRGELTASEQMAITRGMAESSRSGARTTQAATLTNFPAASLPGYAAPMQYLTNKSNIAANMQMYQAMQPDPLGALLGNLAPTFLFGAPGAGTWKGLF